MSSVQAFPIVLDNDLKHALDTDVARVSNDLPASERAFLLPFVAALYHDVAAVDFVLEPAGQHAHRVQGLWTFGRTRDAGAPQIRLYTHPSEGAYWRDEVTFIVFVDVEGGGQAGQMFWTEKTGIKPLVRYFGDPTRIAMRWGTDGRDMVWLYGEGELVNGTPYLFKNMVVKTAPYLLDAAEVAKSERTIGPNPIASDAIPSPFRVGCGYAATLSSNVGASVNGPAIVRLSDGVWWKILPNTLPYASDAMGLSCEHAYFAAPDGTPIRIPLASLPPGGMAGW